MSPAARRFATLLSLALCAPSLAQSPSGPTYAGRPLSEALRALERRGLRLIFSSELVRPELRVVHEPLGDTPRAVLDELLRPHGLRAQPGPGRSLLVVSAPPAAEALDVLPHFRLPNPKRFREDLEVTALTESNPGAGPTPLALRPLDVMAVAGAVENVFRALHTLPGVAALNELEGRMSVRGGGPDQNLTLLDGVEVHNPYRLYGLASAFNPETVASFELMTGAFHPRFGDRLSSILSVETRPGSRARRVSGSGALSLTDANAVVEGRLPGPGRGSFLLTGRRTYYDLVVGQLYDGQLPSFDDLQLKTSWELGTGRRLSLLALRNREGALVDPGKPGQFTSSTRGELFSTRLVTPIGRSALADTVLSVYQHTEELGLLDEFSYGSYSSQSDREELLLAREVRVEDLALRHELALGARGRHRLGAGLEAHVVRTGVAWRENVVPFQTLPGPWQQPAGAGRLAELELPARFRGGLWVHDELQATPRLRVSAGLRLDRGGLQARTTLAPRTSARLELGERTSLSLSLGLHAQSTGWEKFLQRDYFFRLRSLFDLSELQEQGLKSERSLQLVAGFERRLAPRLELKLEAYFRRFDDLVVARLESESERQARLARYDLPPELQVHLAPGPRLTRQPANDGSGRSYGLELLLARRRLADGAGFGGWLAYSFGRAQREAYGRSYPFDYDRRHALTAVASYRPWSALELSATARVASGFPLTTPLLRVVTEPDSADRDGDGNRDELVPSLSENDNVRFQLDFDDLPRRERVRAPLYARLDLRASFRPRRGRFTFYVDVINATGRRNSLLPEYGWETDEDEGGVRVRAVRGPSLPLIPSLGVHLRF